MKDCCSLESPLGLVSFLSGVPMKPLALSFSKIVLTVSSALMLSACGDHNVATPEELTAGQEIYEYHCATCHKKNGVGNFRLGAPDIRNTKLSKKQIVAKVQGHMANEETRMPAMDKLTKDNLKKIASYVKSL